MICKIADYTIEGKWTDSIDESLELNFAEINRVNNNPYYQDIGEFKESFTIKGEFVKQKIYILDKLEEIAKAKEPVRFTTLKDSFLVIITSIKKSKNTFLRGAHLVQPFEITLKRWYW
jgi:phage protein U